MAEKNKQRLSYIDWMRGLACVFMFQTHCYDSWLSDDARHSTWFKWSQLGGTLPAPLFLFLAGISFALVTDRLRSKGIAAGEIASTTVRCRSHSGNFARTGHQHRRVAARRADDRSRHSAALDDASSALAAVVSRVLRQRRAHLRQGAAVAVSAVSLGGICVCRTRCGILANE